MVLRPSIIFDPEDGFFAVRRHGRYSPVLLIGGGQTAPAGLRRRRRRDRRATSVDGVPGRIYELGGPEISTFRELLEEM